MRPSAARPASSDVPAAAAAMAAKAPVIAPAIGPSDSIARVAERPLATQPGAISIQVQRARALLAQLSAHVAATRARNRTSDAPRLARLLVEEGLAAERAGDLGAAAKAFGEALDLGVASRPAAQLARRAGARAPLDAKLALLDKETSFATDEGERADLAVERARLLEAAPDRLVDAIESYRTALALRPSHAEALEGLEGALVRARARLGESFDPQLAEHRARIAAAYGNDPELAASIHAARARILEERGDLVGAEEAYAASLAADGRVGPVREAYKRLLARRGAWARLRESIAEEAGREHDLPRSVRLLHEAARISLDRLDDAPQAIGLLEHAASRAPTDPAVDARVLDELVRLLEARGDARGAATARRALLAHEADPSARAVGLRRLGGDLEVLGDLPGAISALEEALALEPLHPPTQITLDRIYRVAGANEQRIRLWLEEAAKAREPSRRAAAYVRAAHVAEDDLGRPEEALEYLRAAWVTDTGNVDALDELTRLLLPPTEVRTALGGGDGRSARALIELFSQAAQTAREPARKIAYLEKVAALWEDALGNPAEAARIYEKVLAIEPTRRFALLALQRAHERSGNFEALAAAIEVEAEQTSDPQLAAALRLRAARTWHGRAAAPDRSIALARRVLDTRPGDAAALRVLLEAHEAAGRWEEVAKTLEAIVAAIPSGGGAREALPSWIDLGEIRRRRLGDLEGAIGAWRAAIAIDPTHPVATRELAEALRARGSHRELAELEEGVARATVEPHAAARAWIRAAELWEGRLSDDARAQAAYGKALVARPADLSAWDGLARLAERRGAHDELATAYKLRLEREESDGQPRLPLRIALAELRSRGKDDDAAIAALEAVLAEAPAHVPTLRLLEAIHRRAGNDAGLAKVLPALAHAIKDPLAKRGVLWDLVRLQERTGEAASSPPIAAYLLIYELDQTDEASLSAIVRHAIARMRGVMHESAPSDGLPNVRGLLAFGLRRQLATARDPQQRGILALQLADLLEDSTDPREHAEALALYREALSLDRGSPTAIAGVRRMGAVLVDHGAQFSGEIAAAETALEVPERVGHLLRAADLAPRVAPPEGGEAVATDLAIRALREDPDSPEAASAVSGSLSRQGDVRRLVDVLMEAASGAKRVDRIVALAREGAHHAAGALSNVPVAIALLSQAREADPRDPTLLVELGELYVQQRAWAEAAKAYADAVEAAGKEGRRDILVRAHRALAALHEGPLEDPDRALEELRRVCALAPDDVDAQRRLATALHARGDLDGALAALGQLVAAPNLPPREHVGALAQIAELRAQQGDLRGAEEALADAIKIDPDPSHEPFARFTAHHARIGGDAAIAAALGTLVEAEAADPRWLRYLGDLEVQRLGRPNEGLAHLRRAVQAAAEGRGDLSAAQLSLGEALLGVGALDDAARTLRELLLRDPTHAGGLAAGSRATTALARRDEGLVIDEIRAYFGFEGTPAAFRARRLSGAPPRPGSLDDVSIHAHVMPVAAKVPAYEIINALADQLSKVYAPGLAALGLSSRDRHTSRSAHPLRPFVDRAAQVLGVPEVDLYVHDAKGQRVVVENSEPPAIVVPSSLSTLPELEIAFAIGRLVTRVATRTYLLEKLPPHEVEDLLYAAVGPFGGPAPRTRHAEVDDLGRRVQRAISRRARRQLEEIAPRFSGIEPVRFVRAVDQGTIRTAYLLTGDLTSAVDHLRRYDERVMNDLGPETIVGDLLRFALSDGAAALRRRVGTTWG